MCNPKRSLPLPDGYKVPPDESKRVLDGSAAQGDPFTFTTDLHHCLSVLGKCRQLLESQILLNQSTVLAEAQNKIMDVLKEIEHCGSATTGRPRQPNETMITEPPKPPDEAPAGQSWDASALLERNPFWHSQALFRIQKRLERNRKGRTLAQAMAEITESDILEEGRRYAL